MEGDFAWIEKCVAIVNLVSKAVLLMSEVTEPFIVANMLPLSPDTGNVLTSVVGLLDVGLEVTVVVSPFKKNQFKILFR